MKQLPAEIAVGGTRTAGCGIEIMTHEKVPCIMKEQENMSISEKLNIVHQAVSKRRLAALKDLHKYLTKEGLEWPDR